MHCILQANEIVMDDPGPQSRRRRLSKNLATTSSTNLAISSTNTTRGQQQRAKKWPLLVRSLSDSAKYRRQQGSNHAPSAKKTVETKALTLSLSDSRLFTHKKCSFMDFIYNDKEAETCSCGCEQDFEPDLQNLANLANFGGSVEIAEDEEFSEDEGCFVITSVPQSHLAEEVTNKVRF